jgi:hypothetical protein
LVAFAAEAVDGLDEEYFAMGHGGRKGGGTAVWKPN